MDHPSPGAEGRSSADVVSAEAAEPTAASLIGPAADLAIASPGGPVSPSLSGVFGTTGRKAFLMGLLPSLSLDEIWMLQISLARLDLRTDVFGRLPTELQMIVTDYLSPVDVGICLYVSSPWRAAFRHEGMHKALSRRCFPALAEYVQTAAATLAKTTAPTAAEQLLVANRLFVEEARKYVIRALGRFRYVFRHCQFPPLSLTEGPNHDGGHIAAQAKLRWFRHHVPLSRPHQHHPREPQQDSSVLDPPDEHGTAHGSDDIGDDDRANSHNAHRNDNDISDDNNQDGSFTSPCYTGFEYAYGRLSWQYIMEDGTAFLVDDLRDGRRLHCKVQRSELRGETYLQSALGDEILVASTGLRLHAWHLASDEHCTAQLPAQVDVVATLGRRICILSLGNVYCWEFNGKVRQVDVTGLDPKHLQPDRDGRLPSYFMLDPLNEDVFFLGNFDIETDNIGYRGNLCFYVHRIQGLRYRETFVQRLSFQEGAIPSMLIENTVRRNVRGLYSLATWRVSSGHNKYGNSAAIHIEEVASMGFNIYTHTFSRSSFKIPPMVVVGRVDRYVFPVHIWNDQLLTIIDRHRESPSRKVRRAIPLLFAFDDRNSEAGARSAAKPFSAVPLYTSQPLLDDDDDDGSGGGKDKSREEAADGSQARRDDEAAENTRRGTPVYPTPQRRRKMGINELAPDNPGAWNQADDDWTQNNCLLRYALDVGLSAPDPETSRPVHVGSYQLQGDDDFLVFGRGDEYTVWSFGEDVVRNSSGSE